MPCNSDITCSVDNCLVCVSGEPDHCSQCNSGFELDLLDQCVIILDFITEPPTEKSTYVSPNYKGVENGYLDYNFDENNPDDSDSLVLKLDYLKNIENNKNNVITNINIQNNNNKNISVEISEGYEELTFKVDPTTSSKNFDIIITSENPIKINLESTSNASIKVGSGELEIESIDNSNVNLNQIQPSSSLTIKPVSPIIVNEVEFKQGKYEKGKILINSDDNTKVQLNYNKEGKE